MNETASELEGFLSRLRSEIPQLGMCVMYPAAGVIERIGPDWDWIWIDGQHGELDYEDMLSLVRTCDLIGRPALVRVAGHERGAISRTLDLGCAGVIVPQVESAEQAHALVLAAKFPPLGDRSYGGRRPIDRRGRQYSQTANDDTLLVLQIESPSAVAAADEIAAVPGVDALFLGPDDILLRRGLEPSAPRNRETLGPDMTAVAAACRRHGKIAVMVAVSSEMQQLSLELGFCLLVCGGDAPFLAEGSKRVSTEVRKIVSGTRFSSGQSTRSLY